jgi:hypothetical protein
MTELSSSWNAVRGHARLESTDISRAIYVVIAGFYSSPSLREAAGDEAWDSILGLLDNNEEQVLQERLLYIAVRLRILDDQFSAEDPDYTKESRSWHVGWIVRKGKKREPLILREACNKIIHARLFNWCRTERFKTRKTGLLPHVFLYGKQDKTGWRCRLNILDFARHAYAVAATGS